MSAAAPVAPGTHTLKSYAYGLRLTAVVVCIGLAVWGGRYAWNHPYLQLPLAKPWLSVYAVWLLVSGGLCWLGRGRWLLSLVAAAFSGLLLASLLQPQAALAYAVVGLLLVAAGGLGRAVLRWLAPKLALTRLEHVVVGVPLGLGVAALITLALGLAGLLYGWLFFLLLAGGLILLAPGLVRAARSTHSDWGPRVRHAWDSPTLPWVALGASVLFAALVGGWVWAMAPGVHFDALVYHLGVPTLYLQQHAIVEVPEEFRSYWVHTGEMLYTVALALAGQPAPGLLHLASGLLTTGLVFAGGRRLGGPRVGLVAAVLFYTLPLVTWLSGTAYIDLLATLYSAALLYAVLAWVQDRADGWLVVAGLLAGVGLSTKLNLALVLLPLGLLILVAVLARYGRSRRALLALLRFGLPALLMYAPWLARDAAWTGNPLFPYLNSVFQSPEWPLTNTFFNFADFGRGQDVLALLRLPWDLTFYTPDFMEWAPPGSLGSLPLLALPWLYLQKGHTARRWLWAAWLLAVGVVALWLAIGPYLRYVVLLCPLLAVLAALNLEPLWALSEWQSRWRVGRLAVVFTIVAMAGATRASHVRTLWNVPELYPYRLFVGLESQPDFLSRAVGMYDAFQALNQLGQPDEKVLSVGVQFRLYSHRRIVQLSAPGVPAQVWVEPNAALAQALYDQGYRHILMNMHSVNATPDHYPPFVTDAGFLAQYAELEYDVGLYRIYRIRP